jgi:hypothetical protein
MVPASAAVANVPNYQDVRDAKVFALNYWVNWRGEYNPCSRITVRYERLFDRSILGYTMMGSCTVHLNTDVHWNWWNLCEVVTHEIGHVFGHGHTNVPGAIMNPTYPNPVWGYRFPGCMPAS